MNAITTTGGPSGGSMMPQSMDQAMRLADMMARSKMVPQHFHNSPGDCLMVIEQAMRWNMSPFAVAQCASSVKGKLMFEGKIVAAAVENSGAIAGYMDYEFSGDGQTRTIRVTATRKGESKPRSVDVVLKDAITDNQWWKKTPDQMLVYHGARVWARRWTPAVMLGVYSPEEIDSGTSAEVYTGTTIEAAPEPAPALPPAAPFYASVAALDAACKTEGRQRKASEWVGAVEAEYRAAADAGADAVNALTARQDVQKGLDNLTNGLLARLIAARNEAEARTADAVDEADVGEYGLPEAAE